MTSGHRYRREVQGKRRVLELLRRFGRNTASFQILEPGLEYWFDGDDACVGYADTGRGPAQKITSRSPLLHRQLLSSS